MTAPISPSECVPQTVLSRSGLRVSRIALGLSRLHRMASEKSRIALIRAAREMGITHFDTAPLYGDGLSERVLGKAVRNDRSSVTIASKVGLLPRRWIGAMGTAGWPVHAGRAVLRRAGLISWPRRSFTARTLRLSLPESLQALRTDYLDILFLHEPELQDVEKNDSLFAEMMKFKEAGAVRFLGVSGSIFPEMMARYGDVIDVIQTMEGAWQEGSDPMPDLTFSALSRPVPAPLDSSLNPACAALKHALSRRPDGAVVVGTTKIEHLKDLIAVVSQTECSK